MIKEQGVIICKKILYPSCFIHRKAWEQLLVEIINHCREAEETLIYILSVCGAFIHRIRRLFERGGQVLGTIDTWESHGVGPSDNIHLNYKLKQCFTYFISFFKFTFQLNIISKISPCVIPIFRISSWIKRKITRWNSCCIVRIKCVQ